MSSSSVSTLVVLLGNARGGEKTWHTMYANLLEPLNADLALLFGRCVDHSASLYERATYVWEVEERADWGDYYRQRCATQNWSMMADRYKRTGIMGGTGKLKGSGAIILALRDTLLGYKEFLTRYDRIILTRSDFFYVATHPDLPNDAIWVVEGEDYGGITDRHHVFPSRLCDQVLGVLAYMDSNSLLDRIRTTEKYNPEMFLLDMFRHHRIDALVRRFPRVQFTVATRDDSTRWMKAMIAMPGDEQLLVKYPSEYRNAMKLNETDFDYTRFQRFMMWLSARLQRLLLRLFGS